MRRSTIKMRQDAALRLSHHLTAWIKCSDAELFDHAKREIPALIEATRDECIKVLVMAHVDANFIH